MYRKVPKDLTEGSVLGGIVTSVSFILLFLLTFAELRALFAINRDTEIVVDTASRHLSNNGKPDLLRIHLNLSIPGLSCEYLSVDLNNALGMHREDVQSTTLHKFSLDSNRVWKGPALGNAHPLRLPELHNYEIPLNATDHYGNERHAIELDSVEEFHQALDEHEVLLVDFHSPRCIHCVHFAPTFEKAATQLATQAEVHFGKYTARFATVDCLLHIDFCRSQHIQAFPTVRVYRTTTKTANALENQYEVYHGPREVQALVDFTLQALKQAELALPATIQEEFSDQTTVHASGCRVAGYVDVARVPGSLTIRAHTNNDSHVFDLNLVSCTHSIHHLSFGPLVGESEDKLEFPGKSKEMHFVHFIQVVSKKFVLLDRTSQEYYEFTMVSDSFPSSTPPQIEFKYDLSPMQVKVTESRRNWVEGVTAMLALIGGVFSASFLIESGLSKMACWAQEKIM